MPSWHPVRSRLRSAPSQRVKNVSMSDHELREGRVGPFVTFVERVRPDGAVARWGSRRHRKHPVDAPAVDSTWWAPLARGWWIAILFAVGSLLFALGAVPSYVNAVGAWPDAVRSSSARCSSRQRIASTYREAVARPSVTVPQPAASSSAARPDRLAGDRRTAGRSPGFLQHQHLERAAHRPLRRRPRHQHVWRPDAVGSDPVLSWSPACWHGSRSPWPDLARARPLVIDLHPTLAKLGRGQSPSPGSRPSAWLTTRHRPAPTTRRSTSAPSIGADLLPDRGDPAPARTHLPC